MDTIYLLGYMGSGKSTIGSLLATSFSADFLDFDRLIEKEEGSTISEIFKNKGEIYFRKVENMYLKMLLDEKLIKRRVVSLGGGTPCYGDNMELLKNTNSQTIYLNVPFKELSIRLWAAREERPLIAGMKDYEQLEDYVRKHLFERGFYYNQSKVIVKVDNDNPEQIVKSIISNL